MDKQAKDKGQQHLKDMKNRPANPPDDVKPRYFLFFLAVLVQLTASALSGIGYSVKGSAFWVAGLVVWLLWFFIMFLIIRPQTDNLLQRFNGFLRRGAITIFIALFIVGVAEAVILGIFTPYFLDDGVNGGVDEVVQQLYGGFHYNDGTALSQQAAENLLAGKDPYSNSNIVTAFSTYDSAYDRLTPLKLGRFINVYPYPTQQQIAQVWDSALENPSQPPPEIESHVCYPAGSFLLLAPFIAAGITDIQYIYIILVIAALIYVTWRIPGKRRLIFIGVVVVSLELWNTLAIGETGIIVFPLLLIAWVTLGENDWVSAIFMGLAVATKQIAWFFVPFYVILLWRTAKPKMVVAAIGIILAVFAATNAYFIARSPSLWLESITSPMIEPLFPLGVGVVSLVTSGLVNIRTSIPFSVAEIVVFIGGILWYLHYGKRYPDAGPILAILPLFFAWRSIWTYFFYIGIIVLARMLIRSESDALAPSVKSSR
jgi:hypothetical protein